MSAAHGRQMGTTLERIRADHLNRYRWAASKLAGKTVLDAGCGIGYGSLILANAGCKVVAVDGDASAIALAREHYKHLNVDHHCAALESVGLVKWWQAVDAVVCFEVLEHIEEPEAMVRRFNDFAPRLLCSVPNEEAYPFEETRPLGHLRHYTPDEFLDLLSHFDAVGIIPLHQEGKTSEVEPGFRGRTLIADAYS